MTLLPYLLYLFLIGLYRVVLLDLTTIAGVSVNLAALVVLLVTLYKSELTSMWFGFAVGLALGVADPQRMGWHALAMALLALAAFQLRTRLNLESLWARVLLLLGGVFLHNVLILVIAWNSGLIGRLFDWALPGAVYTTVMGWLFFLLKDRRITMRRLRTLF